MAITQERLREVLEAGEAFASAWREHGKLFETMLSRVARGEVSESDALRALNRHHFSATPDASASVVLAIERRHYTLTRERNERYAEKQRKRRAEGNGSESFESESLAPEQIETLASDLLAQGDAQSDALISEARAESALSEERKRQLDEEIEKLVRGRGEENGN